MTPPAHQPQPTVTLWDGEAFHMIGADFQVPRICNSAYSYTQRGKTWASSEKSNLTANPLLSFNKNTPLLDSL